MIDKETQAKMIAEGRAFIHMPEQDGDYKSDQDLHLPQPPLFKAPVSDTVIDLPKNFAEMPYNRDFLNIVNSRLSSRVYTEEEITLEELSFVLWMSQGVKGIRGKRYATLRTVPCGGARHEFELYFAAQHVSGLKRGFYHYLPEHHQIELLREEEDLKAFIDESVQGQSWACKASVVFYYDMVAYRAEWRYGVYAHRIALVDAGYPSQNIYLAATSLGLGSCAIGAVGEDICNKAFGLDGNEEFIFLAQTLGRVKASDRQKELDFYAFIKEYE